MHYSKKYKRKILKNKSKSRKKKLVRGKNKTNNKRKKIKNKSRRQQGGSGNCNSGTSYGTPGLSFTSLTNNPIGWMLNDATNYFNGTLNGTSIPPSSNPSIQFKH